METARGDELGLHFQRQRRSGEHVLRDSLQHIRVPRVILEELARQLDCIPRHAVDASEARIVHAREQVMQSVAKLVEQRHDVVVCEQRRAGTIRRHTFGWVTARGQEIADEIRNRQRRT